MLYDRKVKQNDPFCFKPSGEGPMFDHEGNRKYLNWPEREAFFKAVKSTASPSRRAFCMT